jgi:hypothetical protein
MANIEYFDKPLKSRWDELDSDRKDFLDTARDAAEVTLPYLMPPEGHSPGSELTRPYQSLGARGVNNLASKLILALFPPQAPFFRLELIDELVQQMASAAEQATGNGATAKDEIAKGIGRLEKRVMDEIDSKRHRVQLYEAFRNLIVTGNTAIRLNDDGSLKTFKLDAYACKRDAEGNLLELIVHEEVSPRTLDEDLRTGITDLDKPVDLFTGIKLNEDGQSYSTYQELNDNQVSDTEGTYKLDNMPWLVLRWSTISGEDYGRGLVEDYLGDLQSLNGFSKMLLEAGAAAARVLFLVNPNGPTKIKTLAEAPNMSYIKGNADDVTTVQLDKLQDFQVAQTEKTEIEGRLKQAFLLNSAVRRDAERVTAEEIRFVAGELEETLGGTYAVLSEELQSRLLDLVLVGLKASKAFPNLPDKAWRIKIVTGLEGLGRNHDAQKLLAFVQSAASTLPEAGRYLNPTTFLQRLATAQGIDSTGLLKTPQELQAEQAAAQRQQMVTEAAPGVAQEAVKQMGARNGA